MAQRFHSFYTNCELFFPHYIETVVTVTVITSQFAKILSAKHKTEMIREILGPRKKIRISVYVVAMIPLLHVYVYAHYYYYYYYQFYLQSAS